MAVLSGGRAKRPGNALRNIKGLDDVLNVPSKLKGNKPEELYKYLMDNGYNPNYPQVRLEQ
ncbi:hypothetical protein M5X16_16745 [Paenibacillus chitinolyticus]|uniref:Uncharacterized protein n=2 Tax=Paenibacillus chitinolyticus TaxID=79263 RepID=A0ABT4FHL6_9BACL|nr:hypothetical protein [Paenibacillus chitinolyticus]MCY9597411.1 hypothetical protein [Paenibacillus chitinolyticus]